MLGEGLNVSAHSVFLALSERSEKLRVQPHELDCGAYVLDCGVKVRGGLKAGLEFASVCMAGKATLALAAGEKSIWPGPWVSVFSDHPLQACMLAQYAGWPVQVGEFFAMGSGAMRVKRGREDLLKELHAADASPLAVGTLESGTLPDCEVAQTMAEECGLNADQLYVAVAPTSSIAGCVQVVSRSAETCLHKMHSLGFSLEDVVSVHGVAPVPPPCPDFAQGIGRTNDAILYGGVVTLWVDCADELIAEKGPQIPSCSSGDYGQPFASIFKQYDFDFYKVDPGLFSPAQVLINNLRSGRSWAFGECRPDLIASSFGTES